MKILAYGHYAATIDSDAFPPLKTLVSEAAGQSVRRVGRFIQLALIGAGRCRQGQTLPADTAVYLSSGRGDLEITLDVLTGMVEHGQAPKPLSFINTVSNSACFYIARTFGLHGRNQFVTRRYAPLESALQLAALDIGDGAVNTALVGVVDICTAPLAGHRERIGVATNTPVGEASHWFLLAAADSPQPALAHIRSTVTLADETALEVWLQAWASDPQHGRLALGQHTDAATGRQLQRLSGLHCLPADADLPWYDSQAGHALTQFLIRRPARRLLHIDRDPTGRFNAIAVELA